jgi:cytochrome c oxidase subunit II
MSWSRIGLYGSLFSVLCAGAFAGQTSTQTVKEIEITAKKYEFTPNTVEVPVGTRVVFKITATDREHGFEIEGLKDSCIKIKKGETGTFEYTADKSGTFRFKCCDFCGFGHRRMKGEIRVTE